MHRLSPQFQESPAFFLEKHKDNKVLQAVSEFLIEWGKTNNINTFECVLWRVSHKYDMDCSTLRKEILSIK